AAIGSATDSAHGLGWAYSFIYWLAVLTAFLTAFYTGRAFFMTFWGPEKLPGPDDPEAPQELEPNGSHTRDHPAGGLTGLPPAHHGEVGHEAPPIMTIPLFVLAGCTVLIGVICLVAGPFWGTSEWFAHHLNTTLGFKAMGHEVHAFSWSTAV